MNYKPVSEAQRDALMLMARGLNDEQTAEKLGIDKNTVAQHIQAAVTKLGAENRAHAVALAFAKGLLTKGMVVA